MEGPDGWGTPDGQRAYHQLVRLVEMDPGAEVLRISLAGVRRTDASFPRESVIELARRFRGSRIFCLVDLDNSDLLFNWDVAARRVEQPLIVWRGADWSIIGPSVSEGMYPSFACVVRNAGATTGDIAHETGQNVANVSNKMRNLWLAGYVLRRERIAASGGIEFEYIAAK